MRVEELSERFLAAQLQGDRRAGLRVIMEEGLEGGISVPDLHQHVIRKCQLEIGRLWETNSITVAREHVATAIAHLALAQLYPHLPRAEPSGQRVVLACVDGEQHDLAARIVCDFLEMAGPRRRCSWGPTTLTDEIVRRRARARSARARAVGDGDVSPRRPPVDAVRATAGRVRRRLPGLRRGPRAGGSRDDAWARSSSG
jgi:hypothetical protein